MQKVFDSFGVDGEKWFGFDLDGTLAKYDGWKGPEHIGEPIKGMVGYVKYLHDSGRRVKIFTARVAGEDAEKAAVARRHIEKWCEKNLGFVPEITNIKDQLMESCFDDRAIQVVPNTGIPVQEAFSDAMELLEKTTDGFRNCRGIESQVERLVKIWKNTGSEKA